MSTKFCAVMLRHFVLVETEFGGACLHILLDSIVSITQVDGYCESCLWETTGTTPPKGVTFGGECASHLNPERTQ